MAGFFLGNGCTLTLDENGNQICDFNSPQGLAAAEAVRAICNQDVYKRQAKSDMDVTALRGVLKKDDSVTQKVIDHLLEIIRACQDRCV